MTCRFARWIDCFKRSIWYTYKYAFLNVNIHVLRKYTIEKGTAQLEYEIFSQDDPVVLNSIVLVEVYVL